jgi:hypothetical protein
MKDCPWLRLGFLIGGENVVNNNSEITKKEESGIHKSFSLTRESITFKNDFGEHPVGLAHLTKDQGAIAILSLAGAFIGCAVGGWLFPTAVILAALNDIRYLGRADSKQEKNPQPEATTVDVPAKKVEKNDQDALPPFDRSRIINESKGLMVVGDMGAAKTCVAQYIANGFDGYGIIVFDPHGKTDWGNAYVITKMAAIYQQMAILLDLLENGDESPLLIICDEWLEIRGDRLNKVGEYKGLADDFIRLFSTKPRKFNKLGCFNLHSPNVEAAGVDSFLRENYLKIYLRRLAKKEFPQIQDCAYPCVLEDEQQEHPTHGHHAEFKPSGKAPRNLESLQSAPINIPLAYMDRGWSDGRLRLDVTNIRNQLEMLFDSSTAEPNPEPDSSTVPNSEPLNRNPEPLNQLTDEGCTD